MANYRMNTGYRADNDDALPEGNSFSLVNRALNISNCGSIKQVARACVDDSGAKVSSNTDETDVTNNYEGFILMGEPSGSLGLTLQGRNHQKHGKEEKANTNHENLIENLKKRLENIADRNNEQFLERKHQEQVRINEGLYPFSTIPKP